MLNDEFDFLNKSYEFPRIKRLRERLLNVESSVCSERGMLITEVYKENINMDICLIRAKALEKILNEMTIFILDDELIVGNHASKLRFAPVYPEMDVKWMGDEEEIESLKTRDLNPLQVSNQVHKDLKKMSKYWKGKTLYDRLYSEYPDTIKNSRKASLFTISHEKNALGHCIPAFWKILKYGYDGIKEEISREISSLDLTNSEDLKKLNFLKSLIVISDSVTNFSKRYAKLAKEMYKNEKDKDRKKELLKISEICEKVPANPATNFHEALQSLFISHLVSIIETNAYSISFGRFDQYIYPYYKEDISKGKITQDEAQ
ncbi:MAG: pyruvate formate lyase family protein, partial [Candidatus Odinarchaeia archaeon]